MPYPLMPSAHRRLSSALHTQPDSRVVGHISSFFLVPRPVVEHSPGVAVKLTEMNGFPGQQSTCFPTCIYDS